MINKCTRATVLELCRDARIFTTTRIISYRKGDKGLTTFKVVYDPKRAFKWLISMWGSNCYTQIAALRNMSDVYKCIAKKCEVDI